MPRVGKRLKLATGVYQDSGGIDIMASHKDVKKHARMPLDTPKHGAKGYIAMYHKLKAEAETEAGPGVYRGSLKAAVEQYLATQGHLVSIVQRRALARAWCVEALGLAGRPLLHLTRADVDEAITFWRHQILKKSGKRTANKTINDRCDVLRHLFHVLLGKRHPTPVDDVAHLPVAPTRIMRFSDKELYAFEQELARRETDSRYARFFDGHKTRARYQVRAVTGARPCEIMRTEPRDLVLDGDEPVWYRQVAKGGKRIPLPLNPAMVTAWRFFVAADAFGEYNQGAFARLLRKCGWPSKVPLYQLRHNALQTASENGADALDLMDMAGHTSTAMTRKYAPSTLTRLRRAVETYGPKLAFKKEPGGGGTGGAGAAEMPPPGVGTKNLLVPQFGSARK